MHHFGRFGYGVYDYNPSCYFPEEFSKLPPWPPYCG
jgi:hypothetical protein